MQLSLTRWFETIPYDCDISMKAEKCSCTKYVQSCTKCLNGRKCDYLKKSGGG